MKKYQLQTILYPILAVLLALLPTEHSFATDYYFKRISIEHGLSQTGVTAIVRDHKGTLWVGTRQGINKVERNHVSKYTDDYIFHLYEDMQHHLWAVTQRGVLCYNAEKDSFEVKLSQYIHSVGATETGVLFGGYGALYLYRYRSKKIERLPLIKDVYAKKRECLITHICSIDKNTLLIGTENDGIYRYDLGTHQLKSFITQLAQPLSALYVDTTKREIYYSVFQKGLYCHRITGERIAQYTSKNSALPNDIILDIKPYKGALWLATDGGGVSVFSPANATFRNIQHRAGDTHSLPVNSITVLYEDPYHNLWAGTVRDGVFLFKETYIKTYSDSTLGSSGGLSERAVISIFEAADGTVWIGTDGGGINTFNPRTEQFTHHLKTYNDKVTSITDFNGTSLLVSLYGKGLFIYNPASDAYTPFTIINPTVDYEECHSGFTPFAYKLSESTILITAKNNYFYDLKEHTFTRLHFQNTTEKSALKLVYKDATGHLLLSKGNTLYSLNTQEKQLSVYLVLPERSDINAVCHETSSNTFWIATSNGLYSYTPTTKKLKNIATNMFRQISYMQIDEQHRLWINASNLLFSYHIPDGKITIWDDSDGFLPNDMLTAYISPSASPYIYMGGVGGFVKISKNITSEEGTPPLLFLQNIEMNGKRYTAETFPKELPPYFDSLKISIGLNEKDLFRRILFRFKIKNNDQSSVVETYDNILDITLLSAGKYQIEVACMTGSGNWTAPVSLLSFEVLPAWWQRTSFYVILSLSILAIGAVGMWLYLQRKKQQLEWKIALHQQALNEDKIEFLTNVSHELRTPLTLIYAPLKRLLSSDESQNLPPQEKKQIEGAFRQAKTMKNIINWVLDYDRNTALSNQLSKSYTSLNHLIADCCKDFEQETENKHLLLDLDLEKTLPPIEIDAAKIRVVISNLLMNALKFSNEHSTIHLRSIYKENTVCVQVENRGIGLSNIDSQKLFTRFERGKHPQSGSGIGLAYCKEIIEKHAGVIGAYQDDTEQTVFYFELPVKHNDERVLAKFETDENLAQAPEKSTPTLDTSRYGLLLVDDNTDFLSYLYEELRPQFKSVLKAVNGEEALLLLKTHQPDLIISDVMMPIMNGYQLCKEVKEHLSISHIPVVLLTAKSDNESQKIGYKLGADFYLAKPFDIELLLSVISNLLRRKELIKQRYEQELLLPSPALTTISNADEQFMLKLTDIIKSHYHNPDFGVAMIAEQIAMSRASIYNKMKQITGIGISEYINKYRIEVACELLRTSDQPISEVAFEVGFSSQKYFSTAFKQATGKTPTEYRAI
jgi:histidine kinase